MASDQTTPDDEARPTASATAVPRKAVPSPEDRAAAAEATTKAALAAGARSSGPAAEESAAEPPTELLAEPEKSDAPPSWDPDESILSWKLFGAVFVVLVILGVLAYKVFNTSDEVATTSPTSTSLPTPGGATPSTGGPTGVAVEATVVDDFEGTSADGLGSTSTGQEWASVAGTWGKTDGYAYLPEPNREGGQRSIAAVELGANDGFVSAQATKIAPGWGLVFRYQAPLSYLMLTNTAGSLNLQKVDGGKITSVGVTQRTPLADGATVRVDFQGPTIVVSVDGQPVGTFNDPVTNPGTKVGLLATANGAEMARWGTFRAGAAASSGAGGAGGGGAAKPGAGGAGGLGAGG